MPTTVARIATAPPGETRSRSQIQPSTAATNGAAAWKMRTLATAVFSRARMNVPIESAKEMATPNPGRPSLRNPSIALRRSRSPT